MGVEHRQRQAAASVEDLADAADRGVVLEGLPVPLRQAILDATTERPSAEGKGSRKDKTARLSRRDAPALKMA